MSKLSRSDEALWFLVMLLCFSAVAAAIAVFVSDFQQLERQGEEIGLVLLLVIIVFVVKIIYVKSVKVQPKMNVIV